MDTTTVGVSAIAVGLIAAATPVWAHTTPVGAGFTLGFGAMAVIHGIWSLIARDPTRDHWALSVIGLVLGISPWIGGYAGDGAGWAAWISGLALMLLGGSAYLADQKGNLTDAVRIEELAKYQARHPHSTPEHDRRPVMHGYLDSRAVKM